MKKIMIGLIALTLISTSGAFAAGKGRKKAKAKATTCCCKPCPEVKDCIKATTCPPAPACTRS